jgi:hypothetical protein
MKLNRLCEEENQFYQTREEVEAWINDVYSGEPKDYRINDDLTVDIFSYFKLTPGHKITRLPVQFGISEASFMVTGAGLKTLIGCPHEVEGSFECSRK